MKRNQLSRAIRACIWLWLLCAVGFFCLKLRAQTAVRPMTAPKMQFFNASGQPLSGGCVFTYQNGTSTPLASYTDSTGAVQNANPVILDSSGSANIWLGPSLYKMVIMSSGGVSCASGSTISTTDNFPGNLLLSPTIQTPTLSGTTLFNRLRANQGSALVSGDFSLGGNWGTSPSIGSIIGTDSAGALTVTSGSGSPGANPTISFTYHDGAWATPPIVITSPGGNNPVWNVTASSTTGFTATFVGTPGTGTVYGFHFIVVGAP